MGVWRDWPWHAGAESQGSERGAVRGCGPHRSRSSRSVARVVHFGLTTDASGALQLSANWPASLPPGAEAYIQTWHVDPATVAGLSASNGLRASAP